MAKKIKIYVTLSEADMICNNIIQYQKRFHYNDWQIIKSDEISDCETLWNTFTTMGFKKFPVVSLDGEIQRFQPTNGKDLEKYINDFGHQQLEMGI